MSGVTHGGVSEAERAALAARGITVVDLSASLNPYGPHPAVLAAARCAPADRYPEPGAVTLRAAYAASVGLDTPNVIAGNGSSELLYLAARAFARPGDRCLVFGPTFGEYRAAAIASGLHVHEHAASLAEQPPFQDLLTAIDGHRPALVFLCNPNNPTGWLFDRRQIGVLTEAVRGARGLLVVDEAYMDFAWPRDEHVLPATGRLIVRSLTKLHAIPGLRLGFALGQPAEVSALSALQPPWAVSAPAAAAGLQALTEAGFARESRELVAQGRGELAVALRAAGFAVAASHANFLLVEVGFAAPFRARLLDHGFAVRDCTSFGLPGHIRVAIPRRELVAPLAAAMEASR